MNTNIIKMVIKNYVEVLGKIVYVKNNMVLIVIDPIDSPVLSSIYKAAETMPAPIHRPLPVDDIELNIAELKRRAAFAIETYRCGDLEIVVDYGDEDWGSPFRKYFEDVIRRACSCDFSMMLEELREMHEALRERMEKIERILSSVIMYAEQYSDGVTTFRVVWNGRGRIRVKGYYSFDYVYVYNDGKVEILRDIYGGKVYFSGVKDIRRMLRNLMKEREKIRGEMIRIKEAIDAIEAAQRACPGETQKYQYHAPT